jgi:hypothetical protein
VVRLGKAGMASFGMERCGAARWGNAGTFKQEKEMSLDIEKSVLMDIAKKNGGVLQVDSVLEEARHESSPLHDHFEWDDSVAAEAHRRYQARVLIQRCKITIVDSEPTTVRAFVSLQSDRETGGGYRMTTKVMDDEVLREEFLRDIRLTIARWTQKLNLLDSITADLIFKLEESVRVSEAQVEKRA